jgi:ABC-type sugar transport system permease subunit
MGFASAQAWILFIIILIVTLITLRSSAMWVYYESSRQEG